MPSTIPINHYLKTKKTTPAPSSRAALLGGAFGGNV